EAHCATRPAAVASPSRTPVTRGTCRRPAPPRPHGRPSDRWRTGRWSSHLTPVVARTGWPPDGAAPRGTGHRVRTTTGTPGPAAVGDRWSARAAGRPAARTTPGPGAVAARPDGRGR